MLIAALVGFGGVSLSRVGVDLFPEVDPGIVGVTTVLAGATPEAIETEVTDVLEEQISGIGGIEEMTSESREGLSTLIVKFELEEDLDTKAQDVRDKVSRAMADLPMGMTAHVVFSALTDRAATVSEAMITLIRDRIGFAGLLMTDDLSMQALRGTPAERTQSALDAGCDVALFCNAPLADRIAVAEAAGPMTDAAQTRAEAALAARQTPQGLDVEAAEDELATVTGGGAYV